MKIKKIFSALLAVVLLLAGVAVPSLKASAEENEEVHNTGLIEPVELIMPEDEAEQNEYVPDSVILYSGPEAVYWSQFSSDYYRSLMDEHGQSLWDEMDAYCLEVMNGADILTEYEYKGKIYYLMPQVCCKNIGDIGQFWQMFVYSHPEYYFISFSYFTGGDNMWFTVYPEFAGSSDREYATAAFKSEIEKFRGEIKDGNPENIERQIHDILCSKVSYDYNMENSVFNQSAYSTFVNRETVCTGYAKGFQLLCNSEGIETIIVVGNAGSHAWNKIRLHNHWYLVDVTWDDQVNYTSYSYYNKSDGEIQDHTVDNFMADYEPDSEYSSTASMYNKYIDAYFTSDGKEYFSVSGTVPYLALYIGEGGDGIPDTVVCNNNTYKVLNSSSQNKTYTITYELDGGVNSEYNPANYDMTSGNIILRNPSRTGHSFEGWYKDAKYTDRITTIPLGNTGDITLYAKWNAYNGWVNQSGAEYWYENGVKQGTEGRGKEIYDFDSAAWYWLDAESGGTKAVNKDVYQESDAGRYADREDGTGKWVRYDKNGHMIKGWQVTDAGIYYFDPVTGTMAKGFTTVDKNEYFFNTVTGVLESEGYRVPENGWMTIDGRDYWYENYYREGYRLRESYRGKEIFDPESNAWYWLDNVQGGAKAVSKDVYQESDAGEWADREDGTGKWVRYDDRGHMVKGWSYTDNGTYYFDPTYGTMAKGRAVIDGETYQFDETTGILK